MLKWIIIGAIALLVTIIVIRIIKVMLHTEKQAKQEEIKSSEPPAEYTPEQAPVDLHASSSTVSLSDLPEQNVDNASEYKPLDNEIIDESIEDAGFLDNVDDEFADYRRHARNRRGRRRMPVDIDLEGDMADQDFEYMPESPDFSYLEHRRREPKKPTPTLKELLNDMPTELKVLMLSDIFDRKFF